MNSEYSELVGIYLQLDQILYGNDINKYYDVVEEIAECIYGESGSDSQKVRIANIKLKYLKENTYLIEKFKNKFTVKSNNSDDKTNLSVNSQFTNVNQSSMKATDIFGHTRPTSLGISSPVGVSRSLSTFLKSQMSKSDYLDLKNRVKKEIEERLAKVTEDIRKEE